jgi:DNA polymerase IV
MQWSNQSMLGVCRDGLADARDGAVRCPTCGSPRLARHAEIETLSIPHIDCEAFYATVGKRDPPARRNQPVIVGGGTRGVVAASCSVARTCGVRSAMPKFQARRLCAQAVIIPPDMDKYVRVGQLMLELTPLVEPLSINEAFTDLGGTARLHGLFPANR